MLLIKGETLPYDVLVCLGMNAEQIFEFVDRKFENALTLKERENLKIKLSEKSKGYVTRLENGAFLLWTEVLATTPAEFGYLAHEIFHVSDLMLRRAGLTLSDDSDEIWAYQIDWLTKRIYEEFEFAKKKK